MAYENAKLLNDEAWMLDQKGSHAHAAALVLHGIEEFGKVQICILRKERVKEIPDWKTALWRKSPTMVPVRRCMTWHADKYWYFLNYLKVSEVVTNRVGASVASSNNLLRIRKQGRTVDPIRVDRGRQSAIFVDYTKGKWMRPADVYSEATAFVLFLYGSRYQKWTKRIMENGWRNTINPLRKLVTQSSIRPRTRQGQEDVEILSPEEFLESRKEELARKYGLGGSGFTIRRT